MNKRIDLTTLTDQWLADYIDRQPLTIHKHINKLRRLEPSLDFFSFLVASSIFSSNIEGTTVDLNEYYRFREMGLKKTKSIQEIDDLIKAYRYAQQSTITEDRILTARRYMSTTLLDRNKAYQGNYRYKDVTIRNLQTGAIVYRGAPAARVAPEMRRLIADINLLTEQDLTHNEVLYFAAQIHLRVAQIHPFADGN